MLNFDGAANRYVKCEQALKLLLVLAETRPYHYMEKSLTLPRT